jgi:glycerol-3-phosphate dehydrogenase
VEDVDEGKVSRKHAVHDHARRDGVPGIVSVVGGKITGYRAIAEEVGVLVARRVGQGERRRSATQQRPLPGGFLRDLPTYVEHELWPRAQRLGLDREQAEHLGAVYGSLAPSVLARVEADPELGRRICPNQSSIAAEIARAVDDEWAMSLGDVLLRRTPIGLSACQGLDCLDTTADCMAALLGWDAAERAHQMDAYRREIEPMRRFSTLALPA